MQAWRWSGRSFEPCDSLPVTDRGFRYGMSLFETVRIFRGRVLFLGEHLEQLRASCADRKFPLEEAALEATASVLAEQNDGVARIYITAGDGGLFADRITEPRILLIHEERPAPVLDPCVVTFAEEVYHPMFGGLKTGNYWRNAEAIHSARRAGADETLLFNEVSELVSASMANVFVVVDGQLQTPSLACGARNGVTRRWVMQQRPACECSLFVDDLRKAEEIFLTGSWYGVRPVTQIDGRLLSAGTIGTELAAKFKAEIGV